MILPNPCVAKLFSLNTKLRYLQETIARIDWSPVGKHLNADPPTPDTRCGRATTIGTRRHKAKLSARAQRPGTTRPFRRQPLARWIRHLLHGCCPCGSAQRSENTRSAPCSKDERLSSAIRGRLLTKRTDLAIVVPSEARASLRAGAPLLHHNSIMRRNGTARRCAANPMRRRTSVSGPRRPHALSW